MAVTTPRPVTRDPRELATLFQNPQSRVPGNVLSGMFLRGCPSCTAGVWYGLRPGTLTKCELHQASPCKSDSI